MGFRNRGFNYIEVNTREKTLGSTLSGGLRDFRDSTVFNSFPYDHTRDQVKAIFAL